METRTSVRHIGLFVMVGAMALSCLAARSFPRRARTSTPFGIAGRDIAFADFKGYEDWSVVSSARTDEVLKVIVANPTMIKAYKEGVPERQAISRKARRS